jgi:hypothetical protein
MNDIKHKIIEHIDATEAVYDLYLLDPSENCPGFPDTYKDGALVLVNMGRALPLPTEPIFQDDRIGVVLSFDRVKTHVWIPYSAIFMITYGQGAIQFYERIPENQKVEKPKLQMLQGGLN